MEIQAGLSLSKGQERVFAIILSTNMEQVIRILLPSTGQHGVERQNLTREQREGSIEESKPGIPTKDASPREGLR